MLRRILMILLGIVLFWASSQIHLHADYLTDQAMKPINPVEEDHNFASCLKS